MKTAWLKLEKERRIAILNQATAYTGLPGQAIEKDWWVTLALKACFSLEYSDFLIFKGGTSLSKAWNLIERFSEDIDLALDRRFFGYGNDISKTQIKKLRIKSCDFITTVFLDDLKNAFAEWNVLEDCEIRAQEGKVRETDPQIIEIRYNSVFDEDGYLPRKVIIETGSRSLTEPSEQREINSILSAQFPDRDFAEESFKVATVLPQRTFLEKVFLLHEEFSQVSDKIRVDRLTRHLYDLEKLMDTEYGLEALEDKALYNNIVEHRQRFNAIKGIDYSNHRPKKIMIIPPDSVIDKWKNDYKTMSDYMFYGNYLTFDNLLNKIKELQHRINGLHFD